MQQIVAHMESVLNEELSPARRLHCVADVRVLGSIGVVETKQPVDVGRFQKECVRRGVWIRPFGTRVYVMPPYITPDEDLRTLCREMLNILQNYQWT